MFFKNVRHDVNFEMENFRSQFQIYCYFALLVRVQNSENKLSELLIWLFIYTFPLRLCCLIVTNTSL